MSKNEVEEIETLNDLKERLWAKIQLLDVKLKALDDKAEEYRKALDAYHKIVKAYLDIIKVQRYAPGSLIEHHADEIVTLIRKVTAQEKLAKADKVALQEFKDLLRYVKKGSLSAQKVRR